MQHPCSKCGSVEVDKRGMCKGCIRASHAKWRAANADKIKSRDASYSAANKSEIRARQAAARTQKADEKKLLDAMWRFNNPDKAQAKTRKWQQANSDKTSRYCATRRCSKLSATPSWANEFFIAEAYHLARLRTKMTGVKWHVDHIVPLQSKIVCGLHNEFNLSVIPAVANASKGNRHWPEMP